MMQIIFKTRNIVDEPVHALTSQEWAFDEIRVVIQNPYDCQTLEQAYRGVNGGLI
jgi:hypothetical protein